MECLCARRAITSFDAIDCSDVAHEVGSKNPDIGCTGWGSSGGDLGLSNMSTSVKVPEIDN